MNLTKLFEMQNKLDEHIYEQHPELKDQDNLPWKVLALQVELGECANEWRGFKKWSKDQSPRTFGFKYHKFDEKGNPTKWEQDDSVNPLLEEYVDCLHFILSIGLEIGANDFLKSDNDWSYMAESDITELFLKLFEIEWNGCDDELYHEYFDGFEYFMTLGRELGFTLEQIEQAYFDKNKINHTRQNMGY